uniref:DUF5641 domain-containing protein n=1 Tax=Gongylonema pulchrum TaxID=637853 RepID=A0A183EY12_9BILA
LVDTFWDLWHRRYLNELREREKRMHNGPRLRVQRQPKKGEVVLVEQEGTTRSCWPMGRIQEVHGTEENIRTATVIMANGRTLQRPISALYPLEISTEAAKRADPNLEEEELEQYVHGNSLVEWGRGRSTDSAQSKRFKLPFLTL